MLTVHIVYDNEEKDFIIGKTDIILDTRKSIITQEEIISALFHIKYECAVSLIIKTKPSLQLLNTSALQKIPVQRAIAFKAHKIIEYKDDSVRILKDRINNLTTT